MKTSTQRFPSPSPLSATGKTELRWTALALTSPGPDGEPSYNSDSATIDRYDGGFLISIRNTGSSHWVPDARIRHADWEVA